MRRVPEDKRARKEDGVMSYQYEARIPNAMPALIKAAAQAIGEPAEIEVSQSADGECRATLHREPEMAVMRREDRADGKETG